MINLGTTKDRLLCDSNQELRGPQLAKEETRSEGKLGEQFT